MISAYYRAISQLRNARYRKHLWRGVILALVLLFILYTIALITAQTLLPGALMLPGYGVMVEPTSVFSLGTLLLLPWLSMFLMVPVASIFTGLYLNDVADAVEAEHYPGLPAPNAIPLREVITDTLSYFGILIALNFLGMAIFFFSQTWGVLTLYLLNGFLLAREYFTMVARRRHDPEAARSLFERRFYWLWLPGVIMAIGLSVPFLNLAMPLVGAAVFTHLYHRMKPAPAAAPEAERIVPPEPHEPESGQPRNAPGQQGSEYPHQERRQNRD